MKFKTYQRFRYSFEGVTEDWVLMFGRAVRGKYVYVFRKITPPRLMVSKAIYNYAKLLVGCHTTQRHLYYQLTTPGINQ